MYLDDQKKFDKKTTKTCRAWQWVNWQTLKERVVCTRLHLYSKAVCIHIKFLGFHSPYFGLKWGGSTLWTLKNDVPKHRISIQQNLEKMSLNAVPLHKMSLPQCSCPAAAT